MMNGNEGEGEETKNFSFTIKRGYPVHNLTISFTGNYSNYRS